MMYFRSRMEALCGCQNGELPEADPAKVNSYFSVNCFLRKFNRDFLQCLKVHLVLFYVHLKVQSTSESTEYIRKYVNVLSDVLCTLFSFPVENILIPT